MGNSVDLSVLQGIGIAILLSGFGLAISGIKPAFSFVSYGDDGLGEGMAAGWKTILGFVLILLGIILFAGGIVLLIMGRH